MQWYRRKSRNKRRRRVTARRAKLQAKRRSREKASRRTSMVVIKQKILAAFLSRNEVMAQAQMLAAMSDASEKARFWADYATARAKLGTLGPMPTTAPQLLPLPSAAQDYLKRLEGTDSFQESFGGLTYSFQ